MVRRLGQSRTPSLEELLEAVASQEVAEAFVCLPGKIEKYNSADQVADVRPLIMRDVITIEGEVETVELEVMPKVPVQFPRGGGFFITFPLKPGDLVTLKFCDRSIDKYMSGAGTVPINPIDLRSHDIADAICEPGWNPHSKKLRDVINSDAVFGKEKGVQIHIKDAGTVEITSAGAAVSDDFVAMAKKVDDFIAAVHTVFSSGWVVLPKDGGAALKTAWLAAFGTPPITATVASSNLKADN